MAAVLVKRSIKVPVIDVFGKMKNFSCLRCEQGYKNKKIGDYKFFSCFANSKLYFLWYCEQGLRRLTQTLLEGSCACARGRKRLLALNSQPLHKSTTALQVAHFIINDQRLGMSLSKKEVEYDHFSPQCGSYVKQMMESV